MVEYGRRLGSAAAQQQGEAAGAPQGEAAVQHQVALLARQQAPPGRA